MDYSTIAIIASLLGVMFGMGRIVRTFREDLDKTSEKTKQDINKVFARFDDHKESIDKKLFLLQDINNNSFVRRDNCTLQTEVFKEMFNDIKTSLNKVDKKLDIYIGKQLDFNHG